MLKKLDDEIFLNFYLLYLLFNYYFKLKKYYLNIFDSWGKKITRFMVITKILSNFYFFFNSIMTSVIFPFMINCLETGYYSICKIIIESIHRIVHPLWKL